MLSKPAKEGSEARPAVGDLGCLCDVLLGPRPLLLAALLPAAAHHSPADHQLALEASLHILITDVLEYLAYCFAGPDLIVTSGSVAEYLAYMVSDGVSAAPSVADFEGGAPHSARTS